MFSVKEKQYIAGEIEKILLSLKHPEMPTEKPEFEIHIAGKEKWSYADILPNHHYENGITFCNPWNEIAREVMSKE